MARGMSLRSLPSAISFATYLLAESLCLLRLGNEHCSFLGQSGKLVPVHTIVEHCPNSVRCTDSIGRLDTIITMTVKS